MFSSLGIFKSCNKNSANATTNAPQSLQKINKKKNKKQNKNHRKNNKMNILTCFPDKEGYQHN